MNLLSERVAIVTGAGTGIGQSIALALAAEGAKVVLAARRVEKLEAVAAEIRTAGGTALLVPTDVTSEADVINLFRQTAEAFERLDILVNNAGVAIGARADAWSLANWRKVIDVNLTGAFLCSREALKMMKARGSGRIINIGSVSAKVPRPHAAAYTASKFGLEGLTRSMALDAREFGIAVSIVHPGNTETAVWDDRMEVARQEGVMNPREVARVIMTVASLPPEVNLLESIVLPVSMPFLGRG